MVLEAIIQKYSDSQSTEFLSAAFVARNSVDWLSEYCFAIYIYTNIYTTNNPLYKYIGVFSPACPLRAGPWPPPLPPPLHSLAS